MTDADDLQRTRHQTRFRGANDLLAAAIARRDGQLVEIVTFICECGEASCLEPVQAPFVVYRRVRAVAHRFLLAPGHTSVGVELLVEQTRAYEIVEKATDGARRLAEQWS